MLGIDSTMTGPLPSWLQLFEGMLDYDSHQVIPAPEGTSIPPQTPPVPCRISDEAPLQPNAFSDGSDTDPAHPTYALLGAGIMWHKR